MENLGEESIQGFLQSEHFHIPNYEHFHIFNYVFVT